MRASRVGLALVARRAVRAGEHVQPVELVAGVAHVAAYGGVGPLPVAVAVEAQVQLDQRAHGIDLVVAELQRLHPLAGQLGADHVVVVEGHRAVGLEATGAWLADVVHERGEADHEVRGPADRAAAPSPWPARARSGCARRRPCGGGARRARAPARAARAAPGRRGRSRPGGSGRGADGVRTTSLTSSSRTRSAEMISMRPAISVIACLTSGATSKPSCAANRAARIMRSGSSPNESSGRPGVRSTSVGQVQQAAVRVHEPVARARAPPSR